MSDPTDLPSLPAIPEPVTFDRLRALLEPEGYAVEEAGPSLRRRFPHAEVAVSLPAGEAPVMLVGAVRIGPPIPLASRPDMEAFVNDWHRERIWPVVVLGEAEAGLTLHTHVGVDTAVGLTDAQLIEYVRVGVGTAEQCFATIDVAEA